MSKADSISLSHEPILDLDTLSKKSSDKAKEQEVKNTLAGLSPVGFACQPDEPTDKEVCDMVDSAVSQVLGARGLAEIIKPGDRVVIKVNLVSPHIGRRGEKGRGIITDPRIVRYVAEKVREIIGFGGTADLKVVDALFYGDKNPSMKIAPNSFYWARLERCGDNAVDSGDVCYDSDGDGILDGSSRAEIANLDSFDETRRFSVDVRTADSGTITVSMPKFLRRREDAAGSDEYCDVLIGLPTFKSHVIAGVTGAIKLHYGFRHYDGMQGDTGRWGHNGLYWDEFGRMRNKQIFFDYLCAQHIVRPYDFVIMDCLTGNRKGPVNAAGEIASNSNTDEPVDYILTNAVMASADPVAIDTVEAVFAGYDPKTVGLLETGYRNGLGTNKPENIDLQGLKSFYKHRKALLKNYSRDRYPFEDGWGDAWLDGNYDCLFTIKVKRPELAGKYRYSIKYTIGAPKEIKHDIARVELMVHNGRVKYLNNKGKLSEGEFIVDLEELGLPKDGCLPCIIVVWDQIFNCVMSGEFYINP